MLDYFILIDLLDPQDRKKMIMFSDHTIMGQVSAFICEFTRTHYGHIFQEKHPMDRKKANEWELRGAEDYLVHEKQD